MNGLSTISGGSPKATVRTFFNALSRIYSRVIDISLLPRSKPTSSGIRSRRIAERGAVETARRQLQKIGQVMRYAVVQGLIEYDPTANLRGLIKPSLLVQHHKCITNPSELGRLLRAIDAYQANVSCSLCAEAIAHAVCTSWRTPEDGVDRVLTFMAAEWRIPKEKMKDEGSAYCAIGSTGSSYSVRAKAFDWEWSVRFPRPKGTANVRKRCSCRTDCNGF